MTSPITNLDFFIMKTVKIKESTHTELSIGQTFNDVYKMLIQEHEEKANDKPSKNNDKYQFRVNLGNWDRDRSSRSSCIRSYRDFEPIRFPGNYYLWS